MDATLLWAVQADAVSLCLRGLQHGCSAGLAAREAELWLAQGRVSYTHLDVLASLLVVCCDCLPYIYEDLMEAWCS